MRVLIGRDAGRFTTTLGTSSDLAKQTQLRRRKHTIPSFRMRHMFPTGELSARCAFFDFRLLSRNFYYFSGSSARCSQTVGDRRTVAISAHNSDKDRDTRRDRVLRSDRHPNELRRILCVLHLPYFGTHSAVEMWDMDLGTSGPFRARTRACDWIDGAAAFLPAQVTLMSLNFVCLFPVLRKF